MRVPRKFIAPPWLVRHGPASIGLARVEPGIAPGTLLQVDGDHWRPWDGSRAALAVFLRPEGWRWARIVSCNAAVRGELLTPPCSLAAKNDLKHCRIEVLP